MSNRIILREVPISRTGERNGLESPSLGSTRKDPCLASCWNILSWAFSIITYIIEIFIFVWVIHFYSGSEYHHKYYLFGLSLGFVTLPTVVIAITSLIWYYNLDRFHRRRKERDPHNMEFIEYKKKFTFGALLLHILLMGVVYR